MGMWNKIYGVCLQIDKMIVEPVWYRYLYYITEVKTHASITKLLI